MDDKQLRRMIQEVLHDVSDFIPYSEDAVELLMLTAATESHLGHYVYQINGPARGIFQMEPTTEYDIWKNYLEYNDGLREYILSACPEGNFSSLETDLAYQILMARVHYRRVPAKLPTDVEGYANYWKNFYNTKLGKGKPSVALADYRRLVNA